MHSEPTVTTYLISEPFERALKAIREVLARNGLNVCAELDASARVRRELNIGFRPCRILLVDCTSLPVESRALDSLAAVLFPLHLVVSGRGPQTQIHWINAGAIEGARLPTEAAVPLARLQSLMTKSLERIAMRRDLYSTSAHAR